MRKAQLEISNEFINELRVVIAEKNGEKALGLVNDIHPADIAEIYNQINIEEAKYLYLLLDSEVAADVLVELDEDDRARFLKVLPADVIATQFIDEMESDDAADIIGELTKEKKEEVLANIEDVDQAGDIVDLLSYNEDTAGGIMAKELVAVNWNNTVTECLGVIKDQAEEVTEIHKVYVVDDGYKLLGALSLSRLFKSPTNAKVSTLCNDDIISVTTDAPDHEVATLMDKYDLVVLPVVDDIGRLKGRITIDDAVDILLEEAERDYQLVSGITEDVEASDSVWSHTRARIPWLFIGLCGGVFGAKIIELFEGDIQKVAKLAMFLPLIAAMGGNVGVQASSIVVQALAGHSLLKESMTKKLLKEVVIALVNGLILSGLIFLFNHLMFGSMELTLSVSISLFIVIIFAATFGTFIPLILDKVKIDPALATGPFITTANDIVGLLIYLYISRYIFGLG